MTTPPASTTSTDGPALRRVGFIGLGDQGEPIAERIVGAGFPLEVWARRRQPVEALAQLGAGVATSPAELGRACDLVGLCVTDDADVRDVVFDGGLLDAMAPGSVLLVHSTTAPQTCIDIEKAAAQRGVDVLDAPVSGGRAGARRGSLSVIVGGDAAVLARIRPVIDTYANSVRHVGGVGAGQAAKIINNGLFVVNVAMAHLALQLGERYGLAADMFTSVLSTSSGSSTALQALAPLDDRVGEPRVGGPRQGRRPVGLADARRSRRAAARGSRRRGGRAVLTAVSNRRCRPHNGPRTPVVGSTALDGVVFRRTSTVDVLRPDGLHAGFALRAVGRDVLSAFGSRTTVELGRVDLEAGARRQVTDIRCSSGAIQPATLVGRHLGHGFRSSAIRDVDADGVVRLLLDDVAIVALLASYARSTAVGPPVPGSPAPTSAPAGSTVVCC